MIVKPSIAPDLEAWRALLPRVAPPLSDEVDYTIARTASGFHGEQSLEYPLSLISPDYDIYYDLRLPHGDSFFQIDCLLVSEYCFLILEVKNHRGVLTFDTEH
ncbi:nuclease-related domain-containing protein [Salimicrobium halophilum]|uniref:nuclease-related domain-containing protein n=1 Tax=Salimicrobium halophilum TaxID=86666 RepID=UPI0015A3FE3A|nr:nuclease-related domain-containing protein [Salimicrobium halophilum]